MSVVCLVKRCWPFVLSVSAVHPSVEPGWLQAMYNGRTGLVPENYITYVWQTWWCHHAITVQHKDLTLDIRDQQSSKKNGDTVLLIAYIYHVTVTITELLGLDMDELSTVCISDYWVWTRLSTANNLVDLIVHPRLLFLINMINSFLMFVFGTLYKSWYVSVWQI